MIESLAPKIQEITTSLLDEAEKKGKMDIVADLASPSADHGDRGDARRIDGRSGTVQGLVGRVGG